MGFDFFFFLVFLEANYLQALDDLRNRQFWNNYAFHKARKHLL